MIPPTFMSTPSCLYPGFWFYCFILLFSFLYISGPIVLIDLI